MMRFRYALMQPGWAKISPRLTISRMMKRLLDREIVEVEVNLWHRMAYVTLINRDGSASFRSQTHSEWDMVEHMMKTNPVICDCCACQWRLKRKYYAPTSYDHIFT